MSLVNISVVGNLVRPPELREYNGGKQKTTLVVAIKTPARLKAAGDNWDTEFYRIETWGRLAEIAHKYLEKGHHVGATGRLVLEKWQDKEGRDRVTPVVKADQISLPPPSLRLVQSDEELGNGKTIVNPVAGELNFAEGDGSEDEFDETLGTAFGSELASEPPAEATMASRSRRKFAAR